MTQTDVRRSARRFGWSWLALWALAGAGLEAAHGFKLSPYLDDELTRTLLRLAHAHGAGLSLVTLVWSVASTRCSAGILRAIVAGSVAIPVGFALGAVGHPEGDPSIAILLVPTGALSLLWGLSATAWHAWRP